MERVICFIFLIVGYFCGSFQTAYFIGRLKHVDIRKQGSGNLGTTNTFRVLGVKSGLITFAGDIFKVFFACALSYIVVILILRMPVERIPLFLYTGFGAVLGHDFPFYLKFKGGKGVAATAAALIALWDWRMIAIGVVVFFSIAISTQYISIASMSLVSAELLLFIIFTLTGLIDVSVKWLPDSYIIIILMVVMVFIKHKKNILRLLNGTENKFTFSHKEN